MSANQPILIAVDWGTSALRGALLDPQGQVLQQRQFDLGIVHVPAGQFSSVFRQCFGDWMQHPQAVCLISGMAGSRQGWREAPYCPCPAGFDELSRQLMWIEPTIALVPGLRCEHAPLPGQESSGPGQDDVMRGEEVQIFGALTLAGLDQASVILPGTHSKWARVSAGRVLHFRTFMTGELYALLTQHSLLARTMQADAPLQADVFLQAVQLAQNSASLLSDLFGTRTSALFERLPISHCSSHLSGLLIGEELRAMRNWPDPLLVVGSALLTERYAMALMSLGRSCRVVTQEATWAGHAALARTLELASPKKDSP